MVRERVKNKVFHDAFLLPAPQGEKSLPLHTCFPSSSPIEVDIGCGRGRFLLARAQGHPNVNFIGIDQSLLRLRKIDRKAVSRNLDNIRLVHADASRILAMLPAQSISTFYVFFPDPWPKRRHHVRRLVSPSFINLIFQALAPRGSIHLCTDHADYFAWMLHHWRVETRFREIEPFIPTEEEETDFGVLFRNQNLPTNRCSFQKR